MSDVKKMTQDRKTPGESGVSVGIQKKKKRKKNPGVVKYALSKSHFLDACSDLKSLVINFKVSLKKISNDSDGT